jgi:ring-1,2-phenylacetyl-CoA epoxidase subunit PaaC
VNAGRADVVADRDALVAYTLRLGDDALVLSHRLAEWATHAPTLEEDVALANLALDLLGQARELLGYAGRVEGAGRDEDELAFGRDEREFRNCLLVERPIGDFAHTVVRQLLFASYQVELYQRLAESADETLAGVAAKAVKEVAYHRSHATAWTLRLGDGTAESHRRMLAALAELWPYSAELFEADELTDALAAAGIGVDPAALREPWAEQVRGVLDRATLEPPADGWAPTGGRHGRHTEPFGHLLAEMQHLRRSHPGASW